MLATITGHLMSNKMLPMSVPKVGVYGLNKQNEDSLLPLGWATIADNLVFNERGTLESRKGLSKQFSTSYGEIGSLYYYIDSNEKTVIIFAAGSKIYKLSGSTVTDITGTGICTANNWQFVTFNGKCLGYQSGHAPIELDSTTSTFHPATGVQYNGSMALSAFGRVWTVYQDVLYHTDLLINDYDATATTTGGLYSLKEYWPNGQDTATALYEWNNYILVFGKQSILVYANGDDVHNTFVISEAIVDVGCISRDSIQAAGKDVIFLSNGGVKSLGKILTEKSLPMNDVSVNIKDYTVSLAQAESDASQIKSVYSQKDGFYLLTFPSSDKTLVFDISVPLKQGIYRCTDWSVAFTDMAVDFDSNLYLAKDGLVHSYTGYTDNNSSYTINYEGVWYDYGDELSVYTKIPKKMSAFIGGTDNDSVMVKWYFDFDDTQYTETVSILDNKVHTPMMGSGEIMKAGFSATISGSEKSLKKYNVFAKIGKY